MKDYELSDMILGSLKGKFEEKEAKKEPSSEIAEAIKSGALMERIARDTFNQEIQRRKNEMLINQIVEQELAEDTENQAMKDLIKAEIEMKLSETIDRGYEDRLEAEIKDAVNKSMQKAEAETNNIENE